MKIAYHHPYSACTAGYVIAEPVPDRPNVYSITIDAYDRAQRKFRTYDDSCPVFCVPANIRLVVVDKYGALLFGPSID